MENDNMLTIDRIAKTIAGPNLDVHIGPDKLRELQDVRWGQLKSQEQLHLLRAAAFLHVLFEKHAYELAFVVANGEGDRFRCMGEFADGSGDFVDWTPDLGKALAFARREDAEAFAADDEDAWKILRVGDVLSRQSTPEGTPTGPVPASGRDIPPSARAKSPTDPRCLPVDKATEDDILRIFRQFVSLNATQWKMGAGDHHHPMWQWLSERIETEENTSGPDWAFIQPENRKRHSLLTDEYLDMMNAREAEDRGG